MVLDARLVRSLRVTVIAVAIVLGWSLVASYLPGSPLVPTANAQSVDGEPFASGAKDLPEGIDADGDGSIDTIEDTLGSDAEVAASTPESISIPLSCIDGADNDLDGAVDDQDPGCQPPELFRGAFPAAGSDTFETTIALDGYELQTALGICPVDFQGTGPAVVERTDPTGGGGSPREFDTEIVAMQLSGIGSLLPGSPCNPGSEPLAFDATLVEDPARASSGTVRSQDPSGGTDYPADSFFDVFFEVSTPIGRLQGGPPGGPAGDPVRVTNVVNSMPPFHSPANEALNPDCYNVDRADHVHCPKPPLDHFLCYTGEFSARGERTVSLSDQFGQSRPTVGPADRFCSAVSKNAVAIFDEGAHLERFTFLEGSGDESVPQRVLVQNQFGPQELAVGQPVGLFVPSQKGFEVPPAALDHFKCYSVEGTTLGRQVSLVDQFSEDGSARPASVGTPRTLCNPTTKTHDGVVTPVADPQWHLVCYALQTEASVERNVRVRNQFVDERVALGTPVELCAPSMKRILPEKKDPPPKRHPKLTGTGRYWKVSGGRNYQAEFPVPFALKSGKPCTYDQLEFRGNQKNRLVSRGAGYAVYLDTSDFFDELTAVFMDPVSGQVSAVIATGPESLLPGARKLKQRLAEFAELAKGSLERASDHKLPTGLVRALGLKGDFAIYFAEYDFKNKQKAQKELRDFFFAAEDTEDAPSDAAE